MLKTAARIAYYFVTMVLIPLLLFYLVDPLVAPLLETLENVQGTTVAESVKGTFFWFLTLLFVLKSLEYLFRRYSIKFVFSAAMSFASLMYFLYCINFGTLYMRLDVSAGATVSVTLKLVGIVLAFVIGFFFNLLAMALSMLEEYTEKS